MMNLFNDFLDDDGIKMVLFNFPYLYLFFIQEKSSHVFG